MAEQSCSTLSRPSSAAPRPPLFSRDALRKLILPLIAEQFLMMMVGLVDTVMVTSAGEAALAGVTLVDSLNMLLIQVFAALATGGAVVVSQYLGRGEAQNARTASRQLIYLVTLIPLLMTGAALLFRQQLLSVIFGAVEEDVMASALAYFTATALAYPFISVYNAGAALFRCMGRSSVSMWNAVMVNLTNIAVNAVLIYGLELGALGAGIGTLISRIVGVVLIMALLQQRTCPLRISGLLHVEFRTDMLKRILSIGVPTGLENGLFQVGKITVMSLVTTFGTAAVAANGMAGSISSVVIVPGQALGLALVTVMGQCMGAGETGQAVTYTKKLLRISYLAMGTLAVSLFFGARPVLSLFSLTPEAIRIADEVLRWFSVCIIFWPLSFTLPNALRAAGDAVFTMGISLLSMFVFRIGLSYVLGADALFGVPMAGLHLLGVWLAMFSDWAVRAVVFTVRFCLGKWKTIRVI